MAFEGVLSAITGQIEGRFGEGLARHLSRPQTCLVNAAAQKQSLEVAVWNHIPTDFAPVVFYVIGSHYHEKCGQVLEAFKHQREAAKSFKDLMKKNEDSNWWLEAVRVVVLRMRQLAYLTDRVAPHENARHHYTKEAQAVLTEYFREMISCRGDLESSRKMGCLFIVVNLLKIYFKINNLRLCTRLTTTVDTKGLFPALAKFPKAQVVAYRYYHGRLLVFEEKYELAQQVLQAAFQQCHPSAYKNKQKILHFLIPVKILRGSFPSKLLLEQYKLTQFENLCAALRSGDINGFNDAMERHQEFFLNKGIFLILEQLKKFVYRNLFKKIQRIWHEVASPDKPHFLKMDVLRHALRDTELKDEDELECVLANLIYEGYMKGYIAHGRCVVLKKTGGFPRVSSVKH